MSYVSLYFTAVMTGAQKSRMHGILTPVSFHLSFGYARLKSEPLRICFIHFHMGIEWGKKEAGGDD